MSESLGKSIVELGKDISSHGLGLFAKNTSERSSVMSRSGHSTWLGKSAKQAFGWVGISYWDRGELLSGGHRGHLVLDVCRHRILAS